MTNPYTQICREKGCTRPVEVTEGEDGPWTSGYCGHHNDVMAERHRERQVWDYFHPSMKEDES